MDDIKLLEKCSYCGENLTLMESISMIDNQKYLVKRCLACGNYPVQEVVRIDAEIAQQSVTDEDVRDEKQRRLANSISCLEEFANQRLDGNYIPPDLSTGEVLDVVLPILRTALRDYKPEPTDGETQAAIEWISDELAGSESVLAFAEANHGAYERTLPKVINNYRVILAALRNCQLKPCEWISFSGERWDGKKYKFFRCPQCRKATAVKSKFCPDCGCSLQDNQP